MAFFEVLAGSVNTFIAALGETVKLAIVSLIIATVLGIIFGLFTVSKVKILEWISAIYIGIIRGTPLLVQTFIIYYGLAQVLRPLGFQWKLIGGPFTAGAVALSLNAGAYMAEIIRGGIESVDRGQMEAARSLGLSYGKAMQKIVLPQAFFTMLPAIINQFIITLKDTSILSVIGFPELVNAAQNVIAINFKSFQVWFLVGLMYLIVITILSKVAKALERRMNRGRK